LHPFVNAHCRGEAGEPCCERGKVCPARGAGFNRRRIQTVSLPPMIAAHREWRCRRGDARWLGGTRSEGPRVHVAHSPKTQPRSCCWARVGNAPQLTLQRPVVKPGWPGRRTPGVSPETTVGEASASLAPPMDASHERIAASVVYAARKTSTSDLIFAPEVKNQYQAPP
jgi:hypothetical protein